MTVIDGNHSSRRINLVAAAMKAEKYLEVGVADGETFFSVSIPSKTGVDPKFRFDAKSRESEGEHFCEMSSDDYFTGVARGTKFDIVFLDGLHVFPQTFRDFCNAIMFTGDNSLIIIDDTIPSDVYSSIPEVNLALATRTREGGTGAAWHGDIYKMIYAVHDFFPSLSYLTVSSRGNPQTFIWRETRRYFSPRFNSLEQISRMTWFDFQENMDLANLSPEEYAIPTVISKLLSSDFG
ncbi:class I SAM-dependent methyltransferase [Mesorhizobium sp. PAMC28654]|uniref:class I SAM-dependent methyltransferase n=1 Tax=Mesorhizobium sp. PAMC28654 TaxID=2880934 RepID=UPI001D0A563D|nr:class I SAM-dependent methyltransferase [Mesorhizobium sp. PAMC28654]UDL91621.1 class I SAM-dependent methyltransferase [Mesorhizobium sp. PAMC28654]